MHFLILHSKTKYDKDVQFSSVQLLSHVWPFATPWTWGLPVDHQFQNLLTHVHCVSDAITISSSVIPFSSCLQSFPVQGLFQWVSSSHQVPKYKSFSFSISLPNEYSGQISFRMDWFYFLAVQGTLKSLLQHHSSKASILQHSAFFIVQLSHPYMTTGKIIALTR